MDLAARIEHTALKPYLTASQLEKLLQEARQFGFHGICIPPFWVKRMAREAAGTDVRIITVSGFPLGYCQTETKLKEIETALDHGADEIDMVWNLSAFKSGMNWPKIEIARASGLVHEAEKLLKVIIETHYLDNAELVEACHICEDAGVDFVKTSTGWAAGGADTEQVRLMRQTLAAHVGIKASGGISSRKKAEELIAAGADRIGTSSGTSLME